MANQHDDFSDLLGAAWDLLQRIDNMTSDEFSKGGERKEREALRKAVNRCLSARSRAHNAA